MLFSFAAFAFGESSQAATLGATLTASRSGNVLTLTLENTGTLAPANKYVPADILTGLFFDVDGSPVLTYSDAVAESIREGTTVTGSQSVKYPPLTNGWDYAVGSGNISQHYALCTAGFGVCTGAGGGQQFEYGIMPDDFTGTNGNNPVNGQKLVQNSIVFTLTGINPTAEFSIKNIRVQYGTSLTEPYLTLDDIVIPASVVPVPAAVWLFGSALLGMVGISRRGAFAAKA